MSLGTFIAFNSNFAGGRSLLQPPDVADRLQIDEATLEQVAKDGSMDYEKWPALLEPLLQRLEQIVHHDFPIPKIPPPDWLRPRNPKAPDQSTAESVQPESPTQSRNLPRPLPPVPPFDSSTSNVPDSVQPSQASTTHSIPELLIQQLTSISHTLRMGFADRPPHTIQRLAELILTPNKHYKTLPAWLRAVDRAVSVTSSADIFPLPQAQSLPHGVLGTALTNGVANGVGNGNGIGGTGTLWTNTDLRDAGLGSDESLGGALLTPIPWLKNGEIAGTTSPRSDPSEPGARSNNALVPEREDGAVTQGELIRMEQEAGIVPVSQTNMADGDVDVEGEGTREAVPHARGPDVVGVEDMGLQDGKGVELQISTGSPEADQVVMQENKPAVESNTGSPEQAEGKREKAAPNNSDGDIVLMDVEGRAEESDLKAETSGGNLAAR